MCMCVYGHSPQELRRAPRNRSVVVSPLGHYAKGREEAAKRQGGKDVREGLNDGAKWKRVSPLLLVLARPRNLCQPGNNTNTAAAGGTDGGYPFLPSVCSCVFLSGNKRYSFRRLTINITSKRTYEIKHGEEYVL